MNFICKVGIKKFFILLKKKKIYNIEIVKNCLNNIIKIKKKNNFFVEIFYKESLNLSKIKKNNISLPICIKNIFSIKKKKLTCSSKILKNFVSNYDSFIIKILKKNNFNIISTDKSDEFCIGESGLNNNLIYNIYNEKNITGGSSSGSAINIALGGGFFAIGSDTGGSIRTPSSFCNIIGFKPTNSLISRYGMVPYSSYLDNCSILANNVFDCFFLFKILIKKNIDLYSNNKKIIIYKKKNKISFLNFKEIIFNIEFIYNFNCVIKNFEKIGFKVETLDENLNSFQNLYNSISSKDFFSNSCKYDGIKFGFKKKIYKNVNDFIKLNRIFSKKTKNKILKGINFFQNNNLYKKNINFIFFLFKKVFLKSNFLIIPTNIKHLKIKNKKFSEILDLLTITPNILGYPSININSGFINHIPIGFQIISKKNFDNDLLKIANLYESVYYKNYVFN